jgi:hypothetical protein
LRFGVLGVVATDPRALLDLRHGLPDRLTHLARHQLGRRPLPILQQIGHALHLLGPLRERRRAVLLERVGGALKERFRFGLGVMGVGGERFAGGGVDGRRGFRHGSEGS